MTLDQYWDDDPWLFAAYREARNRASKEREEHAKWERWMAGMYVYDALLRAAPVINGFSKSHKAIPWVEKPYDYNEEEHLSEREKEKVAHQRMKEWMLAHGPSK